MVSHAIHIKNQKAKSTSIIGLGRSLNPGEISECFPPTSGWGQPAK